MSLTILKSSPWLSTVFILAFTIEGCPSCSPVEPTATFSPMVEEGTWTCERFLTHPIRLTYLRRCTNSKTGVVEIREDCENVVCVSEK